MRARLFPVLFFGLFVCARSSPATELWSDKEGDSAVSVNTTFKMSGLVSHDEHTPGGSHWLGLLLYRLRFDLGARFGEAANAQIAYEHSGRWNSRDGLASGSGVLPSSGDAPFRLAQIQDDLGRTDRFSASHELDRALLSLHPAWGEVTVGRQAIGLGRGRLFSAVDIFSPFSPLEVDREWRRGVDALRAEYRVSSTTSAEGILVGGEEWDESAFVFRGRGYFGNLDAEILGGKRGEDKFLAAVFSSAVGDAEVHGEVAAFRIPEPHPDGSPWGSDRDLFKCVLGASYTFNVGNGLTLLGEYHYSGFGAREISGATPLFSRPEYQARLLRGDTQLLGRHATGLQAAYPFSERLNGNLSVLLSPRDGSGTLSPSFRWDLSRTSSLTVAGYAPWGKGSKDGFLRSEYGTSLRGLFVQFAMYF